jgi:hypothetical protein
MIYFGTYHRLRLHVNTSPKLVLRALYKKLRPIALNRDQRIHRHSIARDILDCHNKARELFNSIR